MTEPYVRESTLRVHELQQLLLHELTLGRRTTKQLADALQHEDDQAVYRALLKLQDEKKVTSFADRRGAATGRIGRVWSLAEAPAAPTLRDPLVAALFGDAP